MSDDPRTIPELISALASDLSNLVRKESELARADIGEKVSEAAQAGMRAGIGAAFLLGAFLVLLAAAVLALSRVMDPLWASILVAVVVGAAGAILLRIGTASMKPSRLRPERSARQLSKDAHMIKETPK
ncbi:MAG TPA: phage holin family protein [Caulobacteraceae bacterium]|nr:phage holin family protein [Caulobacteraceae bacterium]